MVDYKNNLASIAVNCISCLVNGLVITVPEFHGNSLVELKLDSRVGRSFSYEVWMLAKKPNGLYICCDNIKLQFLLIKSYELNKNCEINL